MRFGKLLSTHNGSHLTLFQHLTYILTGNGGRGGGAFEEQEKYLSHSSEDIKKIQLALSLGEEGGHFHMLHIFTDTNTENQPT